MMKTNIFRGELTHLSAKTEPLVGMCMQNILDSNEATIDVIILHPKLMKKDPSLVSVIRRLTTQPVVGFVTTFEQASHWMLDGFVVCLSFHLHFRHVFCVTIHLHICGCFFALLDLLRLVMPNEILGFNS